MDFEKQAILMSYETIAPLNAEHGIYIVRHIASGKLFVQKTMTVFSLSVYETLKEHPVADTPWIQELILDNNTLIIIEEYISGNTLAELIDQKQSLSEKEAVGYTIQLCRILEKLHALQPPVIHRDIKPSNVMIRYDGRVCLLDFNAARQKDFSKTQDTVLLGTNGYAAPEQYGFGTSDERTDLYELGRLLNTMLTGDILADIYYENNHSQLSDIIRKATELRPEDRYQNMNEFCRALSSLFPDETKIYEQTPQNTASWLPPGFRTGNPVHMLLASLCYLIIFWITLTFEEDNTTFAGILLDRILYLSCLLTMIAFSFNYKNLGRYHFFHSKKNPLLKLLGILLTDVIIFFLFTIFMIIVTNLLS